jgi:putative colanic acid biosynthesis acetyltransferase WcaF
VKLPVEEPSMRVQLKHFDNSWYRPGRSRLVQAAWFFAGLPVLRCPLLPSSGLRVRLLRWFGARIGSGVVIKPGVRIKYPWMLSIGNHCWLGEDSWIDNLAQVTLGDSVCISQGAYLCTGNHDWSDPAFGLLVGSIWLKDGVWVGARALVGPGVTIEANAIAAAGSVVTKNVPASEIWSGNPAAFIRRRSLKSSRRTDPALPHESSVERKEEFVL